MRNGQIVEKLVNEHAMTDECLEHLARYVKRPSERMKLYEAKKWSLLSQLATSGILENAKKVKLELSRKPLFKPRALVFGGTTCSRTA